MIDYKDLGDRIRQIRRAEHRTQEDLAAKVGISPSFMGHIERGSRIASLETLILICNELNTTPNYLLQSSLNTEKDMHMHITLTAEQRTKLQEFLLMAHTVAENWDC